MRSVAGGSASLGVRRSSSNPLLGSPQPSLWTGAPGAAAGVQGTAAAGNSSAARIRASGEVRSTSAQSQISLGA